MDDKVPSGEIGKMMGGETGGACLFTLARGWLGWDMDSRGFSIYNSHKISPNSGYIS